MQKHNLSKEVPSFHISPNLTPTERVEAWRRRAHEQPVCLGYAVVDNPTAKVDGLSRGV